MSVPVTANLFAALDTKKKKSKVRVVRASERSRDSLFATRDAPIVPSLRRQDADVSCRRRERDAKQIGGRDRETASPDRR